MKKPPIAHFSCLLQGPEEEQLTGHVAIKRSSDSDSEASTSAVTPRKRRRRIVDSSDDDDNEYKGVQNNNNDDDDGSVFSAGEELSSSPGWDLDSPSSVARDHGNDDMYESFEELSEGEERRRRLGEEALDFRNLDPELYGLRRSSRRKAQNTAAVYKVSES